VTGAAATGLVIELLAPSPSASDPSDP
jgi:hypothetical protein